VVRLCAVLRALRAMGACALLVPRVCDIAHRPELPTGGAFRATGSARGRLAAALYQPGSARAAQLAPWGLRRGRALDVSKLTAPATTECIVLAL
jgi:hypothetical protein